MGRTLQIICGVVLAVGLGGLAAAQQPKADATEQQAKGASQGRQVSSLADDNQTQAQANEGSTSDQRDEADLRAQQSMARSAERQLVEVQRQTLLFGVSVILTAVASIVSVAALLVAIGTGRRELRAYLSVRERNLVVFGPNQIAEITFHIYNTGSTPAYQMRYAAAMGVFDLPLNESIRSKFGDPPALAELPTHVIQSHEYSEGGAVMHRPMTADEFNAIIGGTQALYLVGDIYYRDTFSRSRQTRFAYWLGGPEFAAADTAARAGKGIAAKITWTLTPDHNDAT